MTLFYITVQYLDNGVAKKWTANIDKKKKEVVMPADGIIILEKDQ